MKNYFAPLIIVASALIMSVIVGRPRAQAQNNSSQATDKTGGTMDDGIGANVNNPAGSAIFVTNIPPGYRDWKLISVAHEEGKLNDIRAILGNDMAIKAYREGTLPFPDGAIIARIAWSYVPSEENNKTFSRVQKRAVQQSFVAGSPTNGIQFMVKDSIKYAATDGWGYAQFNDGKPVETAMLQSCYPCHQAIESRDFVFTRYSP